MRFSKFFVDRPIFAAVLSLVIVVAGALALVQLPVSEYPQVVPPTVVTMRAGASDGKLGKGCALDIPWALVDLDAGNAANSLPYS